MTIQKKQTKKTTDDPRTKYYAPKKGEGSKKTYRGAGQSRESKRDLTSAQIQAIRNLLEREGIQYNQSLEANGNPAGDPNRMPNWVTADDINRLAQQQSQPAWQSDPWSMMQPGQAGGRPHPETDQFGPTGSWMDLLSGHPGAGRPGAGTQAPRRHTL